MADLLAFPPPEIDDAQSAASTRTLLVANSPPDAAARARALDISFSFIVEAPAGSGKTGLLLQRFLKLLAFGRVTHPEEVLAITFTRKATAELRERVLFQLEAVARKPLPATADAFSRETRALAESVLRRDQELGWGLLEHPARLNIRTIDSVCGDIARSLPLLSGSGGARRPVENADELYRLAASRTLDQLGGSDEVLHNALRKLLLHRDGSLTDCIALLARMLQTREQWGRLVPFGSAALTDDLLDREVRPRLELALKDVVRLGLEPVHRLFSPGALASLTRFASDCAHLPGYGDETSPLSLFSERTHVPTASGEDLAAWNVLAGLLLTGTDKTWRKTFTSRLLKFELAKQDAARLKEIVEACADNEPLRHALAAVQDLPPPHYPDDQWDVLRSLFRVLRHALVELKLLFSERRQCDFTEMAIAAREALTAGEGAADLAEAAGLRLRHLLVDEMQDTSTAQYDLIELLIRDWGGEAETVFLVGDPKQSIYLFRQARVERFLRTFREGRLGAMAVEPLRLTANFRTQARLVQRFNDIFVAVFPTHTTAGESGEVPFVQADPIRPANPRAELRWHTGLLNAEPAPGSTTRDERRGLVLKEARSLRRVIERWQARALPAGRKEPWRIAVLARQRDHLVPIIAEFNREYEGRPALPFRALDIDSLATRPEVLDFLALTRALLHPSDRTAWLAVLHAPWCGLSRADLLALTGEGPGSDHRVTVEHLIASRTQLLSSEGQALLARTWPVLRESIATLGRSPLSVHVERTWRSLGGDAPLTSAAHTNALHVFTVLRTLEREGGGRVDLSRLQVRLKCLYAEPRAAVGAVELLTIHRSKGLEWDLVLLPGLERTPRASYGDLLNWIELDSDDAAAAPVVLAPIYGKGEESDKLNNWLRTARSKREIAETRRLFYVAATRAREELHLFGIVRVQKDGSIKAAPGSSILGASWTAAGPHFERAASGAFHESTGSEPLQSGILPFFQPFDNVAPQPDEAGLEGGFALAAAAETISQPAPPLLRRLPPGFDPVARFFRTEAERLPYISSTNFVASSTFQRPEGSFAARAFGNVVHRFLGLLSADLANGTPPDTLEAQLPQWEPRLNASLRAEGLAPALASYEAIRVLRALRQTLTDSYGRWVLSPHDQAADECALTPADAELGGLRVDRTFVAGPAPLLPGNGSIWIVDFKTAEPGGRNLEQFLRDERLKYEAQLAAYARVRRSLPGGSAPICLALYYPLIPRLLFWQSDVP